MGSIMAVSQMKAKIVKEYEVKLSEMERRYQEQAMDDVSLLLVGIISCRLIPTNMIIE